MYLGNQQQSCATFSSSTSVQQPNHDPAAVTIYFCVYYLYSITHRYSEKGQHQKIVSILERMGCHLGNLPKHEAR